MAREKLIDAKKAVAQGKSPAHEKQREKRRLTAAKTFGDVAGKWLADARMADSTEAMRKSIVDRDILPTFQNRQLNEITADDLRALCNKVKARGAPATAVHIRDIVKQVYAFAILHGEKVDSPAEGVGAASIATFVPKDRALSPLEIRLMSRQMESVGDWPICCAPGPCNYRCSCRPARVQASRGWWPVAVVRVRRSRQHRSCAVWCIQCATWWCAPRCSAVQTSSRATKSTPICGY